MEYLGQLHVFVFVFSPVGPSRVISHLDSIWEKNILQTTAIHTPKGHLRLQFTACRSCHEIAELAMVWKSSTSAPGIFGASLDMGGSSYH